MNETIEKENVLFSLISEDKIKNIVENSVRKVFAEQKQDVPKIDEWLTSDQVCKLLHVSISTIVGWRKNGKIKAYKINGRVLFKRTQVLKKINELRAQHLDVI